MHGDVREERVAQWQTIEEHPHADWMIMRLRAVTRRHAGDGRQGRFVVADAPTWVNILPITDDGRVVCVRQFRHGTSKITLEIPGGMVNPGEDPRCAAERECLEETGYAADGEARSLGAIEPNPAFMANTCHCYVWHGCSYRGAQRLDPHEDIEVVLVPLDDMMSMVCDGTIRHSLVLSALALYSFQTRNR
jgi:8-oxo-dGTP pyrophosphatase MutT (NUDIX family)